MEGTVKEAIHSLKYRGLKAAAPELAGLLAHYLSKHPMPGDLLVPVPLHPRRLRGRGYNQSALLAKELSKRATGRTLYILDEPTTGLHFADVEKLLDVLNKLVDRGNTVVVIEHNTDVIKTADQIIDLGPDGGEKGGEGVAAGTPEEVANNPLSYTGKTLQPVLFGG